MRDFVAFWCLSARENLASGFDLPQLRIELRGLANSEVKAAAKNVWIFKAFFLPQEKLALGTVVSHFASELFSGREMFGGRSKLDERQAFTALHSHSNGNQFGDVCVSIVADKVIQV